MAMYDVGDRTKVYTSSAFTDEDGVEVDPDVITFTIEDPSGNSETYIYGTDAEVLRDGTGLYSIYVNLDEPGLWNYRIEAEDASGIYMGADEGSLLVRRSRI